jgi:hypothetical protein
MARQKKKLSPEQKAAKKKRREEYMTVFVNGKQKRVKRPPTIDGMDVDEFIRRNADPIWLHQNEMWEYMDQNTGENDGGNLDIFVEVDPVLEAILSIVSVPLLAGRIDATCCV